MFMVFSTSKPPTCALLSHITTILPAKTLMDTSRISFVGISVTMSRCYGLLNKNPNNAVSTVIHAPV
jgi:hypothetical protein